MIQDNQKNFSRLQMLIDAIVIAVTYVLAWMIRFIGPFAYSAVRALAFEEYMFALIFIIPGYLLLYQAFTLYEPLHMQGRRLGSGKYHQGKCTRTSADRIQSVYDGRV